MNDRVWDEKAAWWRDTFASDNDPEYVEQILPLIVEHVGSASNVLDIGTGEGQVARAVLGAGAGSVIGIDRSIGMVSQAQHRTQLPLVQGDVTSLPFADESFDLVTIVLVLEHVANAAMAIFEVSRVLAHEGRMLLCINHPLMQAPGSGWIDDQVLEEQYWRVGSYLGEQHLAEEVSPGVVIPFIHRPLSTYVGWLADANLLMTELVEPSPPPGYLAAMPDYPEQATIPRLLFVQCEKLARRHR